MPAQPLGLDDPPYRAELGAVKCRGGAKAARWLTADGWRIFARALDLPNESCVEPLVPFMLAPGGQCCLACRTTDGTVHVPFSLAEAFENYIYERWTAGRGRRALPSKALSFYYSIKRAIPRKTQLQLRRILIRWQALPEFPAWPYDDSVAALLRFALRCTLIARAETELLFRWFWPNRARAAFVLTHDVESAAGLRNCIRIADLEEERGHRSSFNIVARSYPIDWGIVRELDGRGFELGVHGISHDRSLFASRAEFERQLPLLAQAATRLSAVGFRSPATHRVIDWLSELPFRYDCTVPLSDPYEPQPGGCCSPWPFFLGDVVELPYTLPQDHTVFTLLRERTVSKWASQVEALENSFGLIQCVSHPDPGYLADPEHLQLYAEFLDLVAERPGLWKALPRDVAHWWRERSDTTTVPSPDAFGRAVLDGDHVQFLPPVSEAGA